MSSQIDPEGLVAAVVAGDRRSLARLITVVEEGRAGSEDALRLAHARRGDAHRIGITGAPGSGKSTLTDGLLTLLRGRNVEVGVLAVDPTSPFSGGAVLGDRVRMQDHALDTGVYIRSMASRGHLGGLSAAAPKALVVMDAAGLPVLLIETVGVGQDEVEIVSAAETVVVVLNPGWGDGIQAAKAGILEIADIFVVNKADRPGLREVVADIEHMLSLAGESPWVPPIVTATAVAGEGIAELWDAIEQHRRHLEGEGLAVRRRTRRRAELRVAVTERLRKAAAAETSRHGDLTTKVEEGEIDPWTAARQIVAG